MDRIAALLRNAMQVLAPLRVRRRHLFILALIAVAGGLAWPLERSLAARGANAVAVDGATLIVWCGALAVIALLGFAIFVVAALMREELLTLRAMWRPLAVVLLAAYLLFFNDQCRELGVSLMIGDWDWWRAFFLLMVLVYWALNNWHSARLGIWRAANPQGGGPPAIVIGVDTPWIFWGPRLLGVCAHLLAAASLALAALKQPEFGFGPMRYLAAGTTVAIVLFLACWVYYFDRTHLSERNADPNGARAAAQTSTWDFVKSVLRKSWRFLLGVSGVLLLAAVGAHLVISYLIKPDALDGFVVGSLAISESAVIYLTVISAIYRRKPLAPDAPEPEKAADRAREQANFEKWTRALFVFCVPFIVWTLIDAPSVGRTFGSMVIALFTFGVLLATVNWVEQATAWAAQRVFGEHAKPRVFHAYAIAGVLAFCFVNAFVHPFHVVRRCEGDKCGKPEDRLRVQRAADVWYKQARAAYTKSGAGDSDKVPMLIVATAGGGIRAAYWTATVLDKLEMDLAANGGARPYLFAISGVSGGSVGATAFAAALAERDRANCDLRAVGCTKTTSYLADDYFAPTLAAWIFKDTLASLWPWPLEDRAAALEQGFEYASNGVMGRSFLSFFNRKPKFDEAAARSTWSPILLLNATHEETGKRIIASQVVVERDVFVDAYDELDVLGSDLRASTAAVNSARFTYVSPAGNLGDHKGSVIDGGYYENYGALTALELARAAGLDLGDKVKVVLLMITSDPELGKTFGDPNIDKSATLVRIDQEGDQFPCVVNSTERNPKATTELNFLPVNDQEVENAWINEFLAPLQGITTVRGAHGNRAAAELALQTCAEFPKSLPIPSSADLRTGNGSRSAYRSSQTQIAEALKIGRDVIPTKTEPVRATADLPYFAHVGMCEADREGVITVSAPLGWVLSRATRNGLEKLVSRCGNKEQLVQLEHALTPLPPVSEKAQK